MNSKAPSSLARRLRSSSPYAVTIMTAFLAAPPGTLGLHTFVDRFAEKAGNLLRGLSDGRLRALQAVAEAQP